MTNVEENPNKYVVFNHEQFTDEKRKADGKPATAVLGWVWARDEIQAKDTADTVFPDLTVFVRTPQEAAPEYVSAADKMGYLNTSSAHRPL